MTTEIDARGLKERLYSFPTCVMGGPLHIVVDDLNVDDASLDFCERELDGHWSIDEAAPEDRPRIREIGAALITALRPLAIEDRRAALEDS